MSVLSFLKPATNMPLYCSAAIFIFSAVSLVVPSGYSYGPIFLLLGTCIFCTRKSKVELVKHDKAFICILFMYSLFEIVSNLSHSLPIRYYEDSMRILLAIPVYLLLISYPPNKNALWSGLFIGCLSAGIFAIYQKYFVVGMWGRASGFTNAIQFGNISLLMAALLLCSVSFFPSATHNKYIYMCHVVGAVFGFTASLFSWSRGGWLATPFIVLILYRALDASFRKIFLAFFVTVVIFSSLFLFFASDFNAFKIRIIQTQVELSEYVGEFNGVENTSVSTRVKMWENGIDAIKLKPIWG